MTYCTAKGSFFPEKLLRTIYRNPHNIYSLPPIHRKLLEDFPYYFGGGTRDPTRVLVLVRQEAEPELNAPPPLIVYQCHTRGLKGLAPWLTSTVVFLNEESVNPFRVSERLHEDSLLSK